MSVNLRRECIEVISITSLALIASYYPKKVMDSSPPPKPPVTLIEEGIAKMTLEETREMRDFATSLRRSVRHHSVREKSKEDTGHLPYAITFSFQEREPSSKIETTALMEGQNDALQQERELPSLLQCEVYFKSKEVIAVKHNRRREQWRGFPCF